jgi:hypothetical protein
MSEGNIEPVKWVVAHVRGYPSQEEEPTLIIVNLTVNGVTKWAVPGGTDPGVGVGPYLEQKVFEQTGNGFNDYGITVRVSVGSVVGPFSYPSSSIVERLTKTYSAIYQGGEIDPAKARAVTYTEIDRMAIEEFHWDHRFLALVAFHLVADDSY